MLVEFEIGLVRHLLNFDKEIQRVEFSNSFDSVFPNILGKVSEYPLCLVERSIDDNAVYPKSIDYQDNEGVTKFFQTTIVYRVKIWYEKASTTIVKLQKLRFYFEKNPYVYIRNYLGSDFEYRIGMHFQYISMEEERLGDNKQGAQRCVIATFQATIPIEEDEEFTLIESIQVGINGMSVYADGKCFKICDLFDTTGSTSEVKFTGKSDKNISDKQRIRQNDLQNVVCSDSQNIKPATVNNAVSVKPTITSKGEVAEKMIKSAGFRIRK